MVVGEQEQTMNTTKKQFTVCAKDVWEADITISTTDYN